MRGGSRSLPVRPSLRFLKLEAKRRLAAGEFTTLHDAQMAIAREHALPSWAGLKRACAQRPKPESHALDQLHWVISRFSAADAPGWTAPGEDELRQHFDDRFLAMLPAGALVEGPARWPQTCVRNSSSSARARSRPRFSWQACGISRRPTPRRRTG